MTATYLALLRGVNVGGKLLSMAGLRAMAEGMGYGDVSTYIQSGNLIISSKDSAATVAADVEAAIKANFAMEVTVLVRTRAQMHKVANGNPFLAGAAEVDQRRLHVTFLARPAKEGADSSGSEGVDRYVISGDSVYLHCPDGYGRSKLNNTYFERKLDMKATTRNWNSVLKLAAMLGSG